MSRWFYQHETMEWIRRDGARISQEYIDEYFGPYEEVDDERLDEVWKFVKSVEGEK